MTHVNSFILSTLENGIQKVVLNKPARKNALSPQMYKELKMLLNESAENNKVLIFVLTANGDFFSSGNDISASMESLSVSVDTIKELIDTIIMYPKLLIAVVNGPAIGIATTILGIFDIVYASDKAYFQTPFSSLGLVAEGCSSYTFPRLLGHSKAGDMLYLGYKMNAQEAKQHGLVSKVYNHDSLEEVWNYLNKISTLSSQSILATKRLVSRWNKEILLKVNEEEMEELKKLFESPELIQRMLNFLSRKNKL
ncbi:PREDICTED: enoyl-CoA delta isomerase 2, mitochondrial-like [Trachymyrmex cornetzi]|uniref:Peroxisomal 3,2-trans-enoyl-CoA isomerase n=1 Tax=Trachymyrmex cornetzi TaxID=471704 RepID=A0A195DXZ7_9HYME|nr:PREDICTED: enoyl-CoA delta isomerase 2, mitochondrial-like [Trachymyrmex cornetzi]XP_018365941.1 PREDICTED: enoyl-CoA delta isomerase 2, mitochondrial-like [Trachymyrmex cornetzi]XP_018365942.1 PREDICTED: enoyl-CoA delta isomerase 2, mitochondrial-like [Trachymyrmex cornetzi]KYN17696.1 Peroxisomal 3,2-trans-enoyl-CoA isomerase [Trachymyrmex cornetzi]